MRQLFIVFQVAQKIGHYGLLGIGIQDRAKTFVRGTFTAGTNIRKTFASTGLESGCVGTLDDVREFALPS